MVTAVAGLGSDAITPETVYPTQPAEEKTGMPVEGFKVRDGHHPQTGDEALALTDATAVSCNIYFAHTGLNVGGDPFLAWGARLGFGEAIPFDVPTAVSTLDGGDGFVDDVELANAAYGQGQAQATPLQMALVAATIAERGALMTPHVVDGLRASDGSIDRVEPSLWRQVIDRGRAESIARAMRAAVESRLGRPYAGKAKIPACRRPARAARPSWGARASRTAGSSASRLPTTRRSRWRSSSRVAAPAARRRCPSAARSWRPGSTSRLRVGHRNPARSAS
jgi:cell division protein FtsI/penicillin-binding protein 2